MSKYCRISLILSPSKTAAERLVPRADANPTRIMNSGGGLMQDWAVAVRQVARGGEPGDDTNPTRALTQPIRTSLPAQPQAQIEHLAHVKGP
jgi:hypothetical protein